MDPDEGSILGDPIVTAIFNAEDGERFGVSSFCWDCGWQEEKTISIEVTM